MSESFKKILTPPLSPAFFSWESFQGELRDCCSKYQRGNKVQALAKQKTLLSSPSQSQEAAKQNLQCITHGTFKKATAEDTSTTLILAFPPESNFLQKRYWQGYCDLHSPEERVSLPLQRWNSLTCLLKWPQGDCSLQVHTEEEEIWEARGILYAIKNKFLSELHINPQTLEEKKPKEYRE